MLDPQIAQRPALGAADPAFHKSQKVNLNRYVRQDKRI